MMFWSRLKARQIAIGVSAALSATIAVAVCPPWMYQSSMNIASFEAAEQSFSALLQSMDTLYQLKLRNYSGQTKTAIKVLTAQKALSTTQINNATLEANKAVANSMAAIDAQSRANAAVKEYGSTTGQGVAPCGVYAKRTQIAVQESEIDNKTTNAVRNEVLAGPGRYGVAKSAERVMLEEQREKFCTAAQQAAGFCSSAKTLQQGAGANLNGGHLFEPTVEGEVLHDAKLAFVNNLVGLPPDPVSKESANTPAAADYVLDKARYDSLASPAITTIKDIQMRYSAVKTEHGGGALSVMHGYEGEVKRYFGDSPEYKTWMTAIGLQEPRGLLIEALKQKALDLALMERIYQQYEKMEANVAILVSMETKKTHGNEVKSAQKKAAVAAAKSQIK
jgi:hypothetical protein